MTTGRDAWEVVKGCMPDVPMSSAQIAQLVAAAHPGRSGRADCRLGLTWAVNRGLACETFQRVPVRHGSRLQSLYSRKLQ